jgi:hypothetical protein
MFYDRIFNQKVDLKDFEYIRYIINSNINIISNIVKANMKIIIF